MALPSWLCTRKLPDGLSLEVLDDQQQVIFSSTGKWLHPLLEAEQYLSDQKINPNSLYLHDRIAGRAAAALTVHIGFAGVHINLMSRLAETVYTTYHIPYCADQVVDQIQCQTEHIIHDSMSIAAIYDLITARAHKAVPVSRFD
jgi:hypothetical protein